MLASLNVTLPPELVSDSDAPVHVVAGTGDAATLRPVGRLCVNDDWVNAKGLGFIKVSVRDACALVMVLTGWNAAATVGAATLTLEPAGQAEALSPACAGAVVVAPVLLKLTVAVSALPAESVTFSSSVPADPFQVIVT
jgi:hypothetical protein